MRRITIDIHDLKYDIIVTKQNKKNISVVDNVFIERKTKGQKSGVDINSNSWGVICWVRFSSKHEPIGMVRNAYQRNAFAVFWTGNKPNSCPRQFLNEDNVEAMVNFEDRVDNEIILLNVFVKRFSSLSKLYFDSIHSWMSWVSSGFPEFDIFLDMLFFVEPVSSE